MSVLIKPEERLIPGTKIQIEAAINPTNFEDLSWIKLEAVRAMNKAEKECNTSDPVLIQNSELPHKNVVPLINQDKNGGFE